MAVSERSTLWTPEDPCGWSHALRFPSRRSGPRRQSGALQCSFNPSKRQRLKGELLHPAALYIGCSLFGTDSICTILGLSIGSAGVWGVLRSPTSDPRYYFGRGHFDAGLAMAAYRTADRDSLEILN